MAHIYTGMVDMMLQYKYIAPTRNLVTGPMLLDSFTIFEKFTNFEGLKQLLRKV